MSWWGQSSQRCWQKRACMPVAWLQHCCGHVSKQLPSTNAKSRVVVFAMWTAYLATTCRFHFHLADLLSIPLNSVEESTALHKVDALPSLRILHLASLACQNHIWVSTLPAPWPPCRWLHSPDQPWLLLLPLFPPLLLSPPELWNSSVYDPRRARVLQECWQFEPVMPLRWESGTQKLLSLTTSLDCLVLALPGEC